MQSHPLIFCITFCISIGLIFFPLNPQYTFRSVPHTIQKTPGVGMVFIAQFLDKSNNRGTYEVVFFNTETKEIIEEWITDGKARGFGLRNYWAGSVYSALKKL